MANRSQSREMLRMDRRGDIGASGQSGKLASNTRCPACNLLFQDGVWKKSFANGKECRWKLCPACTQIRNGQAGGIVQFSGAFAGNHRQELLNRIRNVERHTKEERPLERIISMKENKSGITISATTEHLVVKIGKSIQRDFGGDLEFRYAPDENFAYVHWRRD